VIAKKEKPVVLLALDGSERALRGLAPAQRIAEALGAELNVLYVIETPIIQSPAPEPVQVGDFRNGAGWDDELARTYLEGRWPAIPGARVYVAFGRPAREIVCIAAERGASLIVLVTHGRTGLPRAVLGSVAEECVRTSPIPVLVIPGAEKKPPRRAGRRERPRGISIGGRRLPPSP
jgi:nucleotide-binding universal stress UspA family protein